MLNPIDLKAIPQVKGTLLGGNLKQYRQEILGTLMSHASEYGDIMTLRLAHRKLYFLNNPRYVKHVLQDNHRNYDKGTRGWRKLRILLRNGVFVSDGPLWLRQRRTMQPAFHRTRIATFVDTIRTETKKLIKHWADYAQSGEQVDIATEMMAVTFTIIAKTMFHSNIAEDIDRVRKALPIILKYGRDSYKSVFDLPLYLPTPEHIKVKRALNELDEVVYRLINRRRSKASDNHHDLLSMLMAAKDPETGHGMDDNELRDQVMTILLAGHETTANALSFTWHLVSNNRQARERLEEEVDQFLDQEEFNLSTIKRLQYTRQIFLEALRLYPPVWVFSRRAIHEDIIGSYKLPANATLFLCPYTLHRHPDYWRDPETFDAMRFTPEEVKKRNRFVYIPFSAGPRQCMGEDFAMLEATIILALISHTYRLTPANDFKLELEPALTLRPKNGLQMTVQSRH